MNECEALRREPRNPTVTTRPLQEFGVLTDYAGAGLKIQLAMHHLDEGLPGQQKLRVEAAFRSLESGFGELQRWLRGNGYSV
jgi:hypothetical protein